MSQNEVDAALQRHMVRSGERRISGTQQRRGRHGRVRNIVAVRFQMLPLPHIRRLAAILPPTAVLPLHGDQPMRALVHGNGRRVIFRLDRTS